MDEKKARGKKRGAILIITFMVVVMLVIISMGMFVRMFSESRAAERHRDNAVAFYMAEAAVDSAIRQLSLSSSNTAPSSGILGTGNGAGRYSFTITTFIFRSAWEVVGTGYVPSAGAPRAQKTIKAVLAKKDLSDFFWDNAITSAGPVVFNGDAYTVTSPDGKWDVRYGTTISGDDEIPLEKKAEDPNVSPLPRLDFELLQEMAAAQNHVYTGYDKDMPQTFWNINGQPNIVYITGTLDMTGQETIGGFIIVGGDVITDVDMTGNSSIDGCIYTRGHFQNKGGGNQLNINGGLWAGDAGCTLNGSITITYNEEYMNAIRSIPLIGADVQLISWREE